MAIGAGKHLIWRDCLLVAGFAAALYLNSIPGSFVFDDHEAIESNQDVRSDTPLSHVFSNDFWGMPLANEESHKSYRPLTVLTFRFNRQAHGMWAPGFHAVNVLLHATVSALFTLFCSYLLSSSSPSPSAGVWSWGGALIAGGLFAAHPVHTEAVANIVGRTELLSALFFLLALLSYQWLIGSKPHPSATPLQAHSALLFILPLSLAVLSMLSKEQGVTVLAVCAAYDIFVSSKFTTREVVGVVTQITSVFSSAFWKTFYQVPLLAHHSVSLLKRVFLLIISAVLLTSLRLWINGKGSPLFVESDNPASFSSDYFTRVHTYAYLSALNVWLLLMPSRLCFDWSMGSIPLIESFSDTRNLFTAACGLSLGAILISASFHVKREASSTNEAKNGSNSSYSNSNNNNNNNSNNNNSGNEVAYMTSSIVNGVKKESSFHHPHPPIINGTSRKCHAPLSPNRHCHTPKTSLVLFSLALMTIPYLPASNLLFPVGFVLAERVLYLPSMGACLLVAMAMEHLSSRSKFLRGSVTLLVLVTMVMYSGKTVTRSHEWTDIKLLSESALKLNPGNAKVFMTIGNYYAQQGHRKCEWFYREAVRLRPHYATAWTNLGLVLLNTDRPQEAEACYRRALSIKTDHITGNTNMAHLCRLQGRWPEAKHHYTTALSRRVTNPTLYYYLAFVLEKIGTQEDLKEAEAALRNALRLSPGYSEAAMALARLLATTSPAGRRLQDGNFSSGRRLEQSIQLYQQLQSEPEACYQLGQIYLYKGQLQEAERQLRMAIKLSPSHARAHLVLGRVYHRAGKVAEAKTFYTAATKLDSNLASEIHNLS